MKSTSSTTNLIACTLIVGAFVAGFASGPATAQESSSGEDAFKFRFEYAPTELTNAAAAEKLLTRLEQGVRRRCDGYRKMDLTERRKVEACIASTMQATVTGLGSPTLTQAFANGLQSRTGG